MTINRYTVTSKPTYAGGTSFNEPEEPQLGDVILLEDGASPDTDGDFFGEIERSGWSRYIAASCLTASADITVETTLEESLPLDETRLRGALSLLDLRTGTIDRVISLARA